MNTLTQSELPPISDRELFLRFAQDTIIETRKLILELWRKDSFEVDLKSDATPVTEVDCKCEELVREILEKRFPTHGIIGEEYGVHNVGSEFQWTIDPIDGTQNLANKIPTFGTLLGLRFRDEPLIGIIDHPALDYCLAGGVGLGVTAAGRRCRIPDLASPSLRPVDLLAVSTPDVFLRNDLIPYLKAVQELHPYLRMYYDCYSHSLTITGSIAATLELNLKIWDVTPTEVLCRAAGGKYLSLPLTPDKPEYTHSLFGKPAAVDFVYSAISPLIGNT
jgi:fructose-1,6-bisphosphatase/inositol monophosphatase family enzyme